MRTSWLERGGFWDKGKKQAEKPELPVIREIPVESIRRIHRMYLCPVH